MQVYHDALQFILANGTQQENRTGIDTIMFPTVFTRFDLQEGFPAITTKKLAFKSVIGELSAFLRAARSAKTFRELGSKVWDQNANENKAWLANPFRKGEDDLGDVYGAMWREWPAYKTVSVDENSAYGFEKHLSDNGWERIGDDASYRPGGGGEIFGNEADTAIYYKEIDQLGECIRKLILEPTNRRILFHAWNPAKLDEMALPPCHLLYQFLPNIAKRELSLSMTQRSADFFLGVPFNIAETAALLHIVARLTGFTPKWVNITFNDAHIYVNHLDQVKEQLSRKPYPLPTLGISDEMPSFDDLTKRAFIARPDREAQAETLVQLAIEQLATLNPAWFTLENYQHHDPIKADMAV